MTKITKWKARQVGHNTRGTTLQLPALHFPENVVVHVSYYMSYRSGIYTRRDEILVPIFSQYV
jgi:hypothetical protein